MSLGLHLIVEGQGRTFERFYPRPPVLIGREVAATHCPLEDPRVSKLHASIDVRGGTICVRDVKSTNGVYVAGRRIEAGQWLPLAATGRVGELRIAHWTIRAQTYEVDSAPTSVARTLASFVEEEEAASSRALPAAEPTVAGVPGVSPGPAAPQAPPARAERISGPPGPGTTQLIDHTLDVRGRSAAGDAATRTLITQMPAQYAAAVDAMRALYDTISRVLWAADPARRAGMCQQLAATYPLTLVDPSFLALYRHYGWTPSATTVPATGSTPPPPMQSLASTALEAMQDLARWYLGADRSLSGPADVVAFKEKLRASLDELVIGYGPLVAGLDRFEKEMALRREETTSSRSPVDLARRLLDWTDRSDAPLRRVRAGFADLMMHQVALLNGVMTGVMSLLEDLAPTMIEKSARRKLGRTFFLFRPFRRPDPWALYKERHNDLTSEEHERFRLLFGAEFAEEYRQFTRETRSDGSAPPPVRGSLPPVPEIVGIAGHAPPKTGKR